MMMMLLISSFLPFVGYIATKESIEFRKTKVFIVYRRVINLVMNLLHFSTVEFFGKVVLEMGTTIPSYNNSKNSSKVKFKRMTFVEFPFSIQLNFPNPTILLQINSLFAPFLPHCRNIAK